MRLFKSFSIYTATSVVNSAVAFFLLPVFTTFLTPADYGALSYFNVVASIVFPIVLLGFNGGVQVEFYKLSKQELAKYVFSGFLVTLLAFVIVELLFFGAYQLYGTQIEIRLFYWLLVPILAMLQVLPLVTYTLLLNQKRAWIYGILNVSSALLNIGLSLFLVIVLDQNWEGRIKALLITNFMFTCIALIFLIKNKLVYPSFSKIHVSELLKFGLPLIPHNLSSIILAGADKLIITTLLGLSALGVYNVAFQLGMAIFILESSFFKSFIPYVLENVEKSETNRAKIVKYSYLFLGVLLLIVIAYSLVQPLVYKLLINEAFEEGSELVLWIGLSYWFQAVYKVFVVYLFHLKRTIYLSYLSAISLAINIGLNYMFIPKYGLLGAAVSTVVSQALITLVVIFISNRIYKMPWLSFRRF